MQPPHTLPSFPPIASRCVPPTTHHLRPSQIDRMQYARRAPFKQFASFSYACRPSNVCLPRCASHGSRSRFLPHTCIPSLGSSNPHRYSWLTSIRKLFSFIGILCRSSCLTEMVSFTEHSLNCRRCVAVVKGHSILGVYTFQV